MAIRDLDDDGSDALEPRGAALSVAGRDADHPRLFSRAGPRADRRRAGNDRPDLERALQPQDAGRPDRLSRRARASGSSATCSRKRSLPPRVEIRRQLGADDWCVSVFRRQCRRRPLRRRATTSPSRSKRTTILRRSSPTAARTPAWGASFAIRWAPAWAPSRSAIPTSFALPRPTRRPIGCPRACCIPRRVMQGRRLRRARLRQSDGHSDRQRRDLFRPALPGQSAGLLRQRRA